MKILYVTSRFPTGTTESFLGPEIAELKRRGHDVLVVPMLSEATIRAEYCSWGCFLITGLFSLKIALTALLQFSVSLQRSLLAFYLIVKTAHMKTLLKNLLLFPKGLWLAHEARSWGAEHIHVHWASASSSMGLVASTVSGIPWSLTAHRWDIVENNLLALKCRKASFIRFISTSGLELALRVAPDIDRLKSTVLHMGVNLPQKPGIHLVKRIPFVVLCPANLVLVKGHKYLIEAISILITNGLNIELWLAGDGELRKSLEEYVCQLGIDNSCHFYGHVEHACLLEFYERAAVNLVVLPSVDLGNGLHEGIPVSLVEAMSYGVPVVSTNTGGIPELLNSVGLIVPPADSQALARAIEILCTDSGYSDAVGESCRRHIEAEYNISNIVKVLENKFYSAC